MRDQLYIFKKWVYYQLGTCDIRHTEDAEIIEAHRDNRVARVTFWDRIQVIEEEIFEDGELIFYLHYAFHTYKIATDLFTRMMKALASYRSDTIHHVLICCSGGMTSGFFKMRMNEYAHLNHLPYVFEAVAFDEIIYVPRDYDMILVAPQMRYMYHHIHEMRPQTHIEVIDAAVFATYDCAGLLAQITHYYEGMKT